MKRAIAVVLSLLMLAMPAAFAEDGATYEGVVLTFNAPRNAQICFNETAADSYTQGLYSEELGELIVSAAYPSTEERDVGLIALLGDAAATAEPDPDYYSLEGRSAERAFLTIDFSADEGRNLPIAPYVGSEEVYVVQIVTVDAERAFLFVALVPASEEEAIDTVEAQIDSLSLFDPDAQLTLELEAEAGACHQIADFTQNEGADAFLVCARETIRSVRLTTVKMTDDGNAAPDAELGAWDEMNFGDAIRIQAYLPDVLPGFAVIYVDDSGAEQTRYITSSGLDGALLLIQ